MIGIDRFVLETEFKRQQYMVGIERVVLETEFKRQQHMVGIERFCTRERLQEATLHGQHIKVCRM